jgi:hypothetical protein
MPTLRLDATQFTNPVPPGAFQYESGGLASMKPPTIPTTSPTPTPTPTSTLPTTQQPVPSGSTNISGELSRIQGEAMRIQDILNTMSSPTASQPSPFSAPTPTGFGDPSVEAYFRNLATTPVNEDQIRRQQLQMFQGQIDATNQIYDQMLGQVQTQGRDRMGSTVAMGARSSVLGSSFGQAQQEKTQTYNNQIERGVQAERAAKVAEILGFARKSAADEIAAKNQARMQGAESYLNYLKEAGSRKESNLGLLIQSMIEQDTSPDQIDQPELKKLLSQYGTDENTVRFMFNSAKREQESLEAQAQQKARENALKEAKTEAEIRKIDADIQSGKMKTLGEGTMLYNIETGEFFKNPKTAAPGSGGGTIAGVPNDTIQSYRDFLESNRGEDTYTDTGKYLEVYNAFVSSGVKPEDFVKTFDPNKYINPDDPTRGWLESQMKRQTNDDPFGLGQLFTGLDMEALRQ